MDKWNGWRMERVAGWLTAVLGEARGSSNLSEDGGQSGWCGDPERVGWGGVGPGLPTVAGSPSASPLNLGSLVWSCEACRAQGVGGGRGWPPCLGGQATPTSVVQGGVTQKCFLLKEPGRRLRLEFGSWWKWGWEAGASGMEEVEPVRCREHFTQSGHQAQAPNLPWSDCSVHKHSRTAPIL